MAETFSFPSPVARRYGGALFELAEEAGCVDAVAQGLGSFLELVEKNTGLQKLVFSPVFSAQIQLDVVASLGGRLFDGLTGRASLLAGNFLKIVAINRRLPVLSSMVAVYNSLAAAARGEMVAHVTSAYPLSISQQRELKAQLDNMSGRNVVLQAGVDPAILGGLIVRLGSRQLDTSLGTKLSSLKMHLKEVG